jgi:ketosteroid isomerase-like protein
MGRYSISTGKRTYPITGAAENKELIRNMFAESSRGNGQALLDRLANNVRYTIIGTKKFPAPSTGNGIQSIRR